jgi:hypothetical protein
LFCSGDDQKLIQGVQAAAVNVICELAKKNPKNYISLAPTLYKILTASQNNWMLIKLVKLVSKHTIALVSLLSVWLSSPD